MSDVHFVSYEPGMYRIRRPEGERLWWIEFRRPSSGGYEPCWFFEKRNEIRQYLRVLHGDPRGLLVGAVAGLPAWAVPSEDLP